MMKTMGDQYESRVQGYYDRRAWNKIKESLSTKESINIDNKSKNSISSHLRSEEYLKHLFF